MEQQDFFAKYGINEDTLRTARLDWDSLLQIKSDFEKSRKNLQIDANYIAERLRAFSPVHSVKTRIKDPDHLVEKVIRIAKQHPGLLIHKDNYHCLINDLAGVRALHLFREDWLKIHQFIMKTWELKKAPLANISAAVDGDLIEKYRQQGCEIYEHPYGYRSVHYVILFDRSKTEKIPVEIQVRTILEEAWSEVDHLVRYPYINGNRRWLPYLALLNQLLSQADEICTLINQLKQTAESGGGRGKKVRQMYDEIVADLRLRLNRPEISENIDIASR